MLPELKHKAGRFFIVFFIQKQGTAPCTENKIYFPLLLLYVRNIFSVVSCFCRCFQVEDWTFFSFLTEQLKHLLPRYLCRLFCISTITWFLSTFLFYSSSSCSDSLCIFLFSNEAEFTVESYCSSFNIRLTYVK
ncbi:hypothetical protein ILYODFUR_000994 [Ilyodon furcidens]|uniref:Uncharacterized protein n=1 Tax=Ilyodon furcidens TaxID=33524 RepID=A0ABV0TV37_9TELE